VVLAVGLSYSRTAAKAKTRAPGVAVRPAAALRAERINRHGGGGEARVSKGGCLGACQGGRRRQAGSGRPNRSGGAVDLDGGKGGGRRRRFDEAGGGRLRLRLVAKAGGQRRFDPIGLGGGLDLVD